MRWYVFTAAVVVVLIALGIAAVDERDVIWEGRTPICPHCRTPVAQLAIFCTACDRNFDWVPSTEECRWCLDREDARHLRMLFEALGEDKEPLPGELASYPTAYFRAMEAGACTYCAGLGVVLENGVKLPCPVCRGGRECIGCGGDRVVQLGDPAAHRAEVARLEVWQRAERRAAVTRQQIDRTLVVVEDVRALTGAQEAERLTDEQGRNLLERARARVTEAFRALQTQLGAGAAGPGPAAAGTGEGEAVGAVRGTGPGPAHAPSPADATPVEPEAPERRGTDGS